MEQSAVIAYRRTKQELKVVLVTSLETSRWVLPKGNIEAGLKAHESAAQEAYEEAGVEGHVARRSIGTYDYVKTEEKGGGRRRVKVYPMSVSRVRRNWPEKPLRRRKWMTIDAAVSAVNEKKLKKILSRFGRDMNGD